MRLLGTPVRLGRCASSGSATSGLPPRCCARSPARRCGAGCPRPRRSSATGSARQQWSHRVWQSCRPTRRGCSPLPPGHASGDAVGGGWIGYLSYPDAAADAPGPRIPEAAGGWTDCVLRLDPDGCWWYESLSGATMQPWVVAALAAREPDGCLRNRLGRSLISARTRPVFWTAWRQSAPGRCYQACVCTQFTGTVTGSPLDFFADGGDAERPGAGGLSVRRLGCGGVAVAGTVPAPPRGQVTSSPIKGTLPLHAAPAELRASAKDVAENIMIVDLVRNDLGRVAEIGTRDRSRTAGCARRAGRVAPGVDGGGEGGRRAADGGLLAATFPPASVTGTPKTRARQLLSQWEPHRRGVYCGTVGHGVAGRGLRTERGDPHRRVRRRRRGGAGCRAAASPPTPIPLAEWQECLHKAAADRGACRVYGSSRLPESLRSCPPATRTQHRVVELAPRRCARMGVDHPRAGVLDPHAVVDQHAHFGHQGRQVGDGLRAREDHGDLAEHLSSAHCASSASDPRRTSSWTLVSSRHTTARRCPPSSSTASRKAVGQPPRRLEEHRGARLGGQTGQPGCDGRTACVARTPRSRTGLTGRPETASAVVTADGPGRQRDRQTRLDAGRHHPIAGIVDQRHAGVADHQHGGAGVDVVEQGGHPGRFVLVEQADHPSADPHAQRLASVRTRRVSSAATMSAVASASTSRFDASDGWPSGVAPSSSRPVVIAAQPTIGPAMTTHR